MSRWALLLLVLGALVAGCSDDGPSGSGTATAPPPASLSAYLEAGVSATEREAIAGRLEAMTVDGRVVSYSYLSAEDGLAELRGRLDDPSILDDLTANPVPAVFRIEVVPSALGGVTREIAAMPGIDPELGVQEDVELPPGVTVP